MQLSPQVQELLQRYKALSKSSEDSMRSEKISLTRNYETVFSQNDLIDIDDIDFSNDEAWLYDGSGEGFSNIKSNLNNWLHHEGSDVAKDMKHIPWLKDTSNFKKPIDTRTFTRPKKKFLRPSIEKYNEEFYEADRKSDNSATEANPVHFDLSQPVAKDYFDSIFCGSTEGDSFINMSPPSLVTSMCSSTFTNLMENSYIKNDPILREIRDADYSNEVLIQDSDPPIFQSFTESCSSLNSDSAENFLRQTLPTLNTTFHQRDFCGDSSGGSGDTTLKQDDFDASKMNLNCMFQAKKDKSSSNVSSSDLEIQDNLNNTFKRNDTKDITLVKDFNQMNLDETCEKPSNVYNNVNSSCENEEDKSSSNSSIMDVYLNTTVSGKSPKKHQTENNSRENIDPNATTTKSPVRNHTFRKDHHNFINKLAENNKNSTYNTNNLSDEFHRKLAATITDYNIRDETKATADIKRHSIAYVATGSTDSLDHTSSLSNSSRGSNRMLSMAEIDAIVEQQERSLQVMSTPKPAKSMSKLFETHQISPIARQKDHLSDSDLSSTDDFLTVRTSLSKASSCHSDKNFKPLDRTVAKSLSNLKYNADLKYKQRSVNTLIKPTVDRNARSIGIKGSYTNLKPVGVNLPVITSKPQSAPPVTGNNLNVTLVKEDGVFKAPADPLDQYQPKAVSAPVNSRTRLSCLPRPIGTGIPRPVSKIPGPPHSLRNVNVRPLSKPTSITDGYF